MALQHEFYLIPDTTELVLLMDWENNQNILDSVVLDDELILYITDSLAWIPTKNPGKRGIPNQHGINYHGVTLFDTIL